MHVSANFLLNSTVQGENVFKLKLGKMLNEDFFPVDYDWLVLIAWDLVVKCYWLSACDTCCFIFIGYLTVCFGMFYYKLLAVVWVKLDDFSLLTVLLFFPDLSRYPPCNSWNPGP